MSCEDCLDIELINERTEVLNTWQTDSSLTSKTATSTIEISDEVLLTHEFQDFGDTIWDDCDGVTQSFRSLTHYQFFNFPFQLTTELYKQGEENGFEFIIFNNEQRLGYNFIIKTSTNDAIAELENFEVNNLFYSELLKIDFDFPTSPNAIKTIYFVKEFGIIQIILNNDIVINLN